MTNLESISYYEKLHDIFERIDPKEMPQKLTKLIVYLEEAGKHHAVSVSDLTSLIYDMKDAFSFALERTKTSLILAHKEKGYEVNIYPIMNFMKDNPCIDGELDELKSRLIALAHEKNIAAMKDIYSFVDQISIVFHS